MDKLEDLIKIIIPHFKNYPVFCAKLLGLGRAFELFQDIVFALYNKTHRSNEGRKELLIKALSMNVTTNRNKVRIDLLFSKLGIPNGSSIPLLTNKYLTVFTGLRAAVTDYFISGMIDGDGSVYVFFTKTARIKVGFSIKSDYLTKPLLEAVRSRLMDIGSIHTTKDLILSLW